MNLRILDPRVATKILYSNQMLTHKSIKWYFRIIVFLIETSILNSWVLYRNQQLEVENQNFDDYTVFRRKLGKSLVRMLTPAVVLTNPMKGITNMFPDDEALELYGQCHLGKPSTKRLCSRCKMHQTMYICNRCDLSCCLIPCYDLLRVNGGENKCLYKMGIFEKQAIKSSWSRCEMFLKE